MSFSANEACNQLEQNPNAKQIENRRKSQQPRNEKNKPKKTSKKCQKLSMEICHV